MVCLFHLSAVGEMAQRKFVIETDSLLSLTEASLFLSIPRTTVWRMAKRGQLHTIKLGNRNLYFFKDELEEFKNARRSGSVKEGGQ